MNFTISTSRLQKAINLVSRCISSTTPLPSLSGILLSAKDNELTLTASDSSISIRTVIDANDEKNQLTIEEEGKILINAHTLGQIIQKMPAAITSLEVIDGNLIEVQSGKAQVKINGMDPETYPLIAFDTNSPSFPLKAAVIQDIISSVAFSVSTDETRPALTGVNLKADGDQLHCAATDTHRLATKTMMIEGADQHFDIVIPAKHLDKVGASLNDSEDLEVSIDSQKITFSFDSTLIAARLIDDAFPTISHLLPNAYTQTMRISSRELSAAIDRASIFRSEGQNIIKLTMNGTTVDISALAREVGSSRETIDIIAYEGEPLTVSCSGKYLYDAVKALKVPEVLLCFNGAVRPIIIKDPDDDSLIMYVSPVRFYE